MIKIRRPNIFKLTHRDLAVFVDEQKVTAIENQGWRDIDVAQGKHLFEVRSKLFKSSKFPIEVSDGDIIEITPNYKNYYLFLFLVLMIIPNIIYLVTDMGLSTLVMCFGLGLIGAFIPYLPRFSKNAYKIRKVNQ